MTDLPQWLRRLPYVLYALALILGGWRFLNEWSMVEATYSYSQFGDDSMNFAHNLGRSGAIFSGVLEAVYIVSSGALLQVAIAIFDKMKGPVE